MGSRAERERQFVKQACAEMSALTSIVLAELGRSFASGGRQSSLSFLQETAGLRGKAEQVNVRIQASRVGFPRIEDEIQDMQMRRHKAETKERRMILDLELKLLQNMHDDNKHCGTQVVQNYVKSFASTDEIWDV